MHIFNQKTQNFLTKVQTLFNLEEEGLNNILTIQPTNQLDQLNNIANISNATGFPGWNLLRRNWVENRSWLYFGYFYTLASLLALLI